MPAASEDVKINMMDMAANVVRGRPSNEYARVDDNQGTNPEWDDNQDDLKSFAMRRTRSEQVRCWPSCSSVWKQKDSHASNIPVT